MYISSTTTQIYIGVPRMGFTLLVCLNWNLKHIN
jgi:hypothetical protein